MSHRGRLVQRVLGVRIVDNAAISSNDPLDFSRLLREYNTSGDALNQSAVDVAFHDFEQSWPISGAHVFRSTVWIDNQNDDRYSPLG